MRVNGKSYTVEVAEGGQLTDVKSTAAPAAAPPKARRASDTDAVKAVLAGNIFKVHVAVGDAVDAGAPLTDDPNVGGFGQRRHVRCAGVKTVRRAAIAAIFQRDR
mgnify:CR=1 FL=1